MKKETTAIIILTIISGLIIPFTTTIFNITNIPNEVLFLPHNLFSLGQFCNIIVTSFLTGLILSCFAYLLYFKILKNLFNIPLFANFVFNIS